MKTRTLLLLALACGLAIMLAGAVLMFQLSTSEAPAPASPLGAEVTIGELRVTVAPPAQDGAAISEADGVLSVWVRLGGVDDPDAAAGFGLIAAGRPVAVSPGSCQAVTVAPQLCQIEFEVGNPDGGSRVLVLERGDERARWVLDGF